MFSKVFYKSVASILAGLSYVADELDAHASSALLKSEEVRVKIIQLEQELEDLEDVVIDATKKAKALRGVLNA